MNRRTHLWSLATAAIGLLSASGRPATAKPMNLLEPRDKLEAYLRLRARADGKPVYYSYRGTIFGKRDGETAVPLFAVEGFSMMRATRLDDAHVSFANVEAGYYCDLHTGAVLTRWTNPLNGLETTVKHYRSWQYSTVSADTVTPKMEKPVPGIDYKGTVPPALILGDRVWMNEDLIVRIPNRPKDSFADPLEYVGPAVTATSLATWCGLLADVQNPRLAFVPSTLSYQTLGSWPSFLRMGTQPGLISWRMAGVKLASVDGVPDALRQRVLADYPDFLQKL
jgi:hypothetical protein